ncbi:MAG: PEP-utilizing enzyme [Candidatus Micrarchaeia archaeon]
MNFSKKEMLERLNPYVKEVCPTIISTAMISLINVSNICFNICIFEKDRYSWIASEKDLEEGAKKLYELTFKEAEKKYNLDDLKNRIKKIIAKIPEWKDKNEMELLIDTKELLQTANMWWEKTIDLESVKYCDIKLFVDPFIKEKKLSPAEMILFKESLHTKNEINEVANERELLKLAKKINRINDEEFEKIKYFYPKYCGYDGYKLYKKKEIETIDFEKLEKKLNERTKINPEEILLKLEKTIRITADEKRKIELTRYFSYLLDERRHFANLLSMCMHIIIEEFSKRFNADRNYLEKMTNEEFIGYVNGEEINYNYPRLFICGKELKTGNNAEFFKTIENELRITDHKNRLSGFGVSKGIARGKVKITLDPREEKIKDGEILVTYFTNPEFVPAMRKSSGIITESGGMTSHATIISREFKIPCIVGVKNAVTQLRNGELIQINGETGEITRI